MEKTNSRSPSSYSTTSKSYKAFLAYVLRQTPKPEKPNLLVNLYLDSFLLYSKKICAQTVVEAGLCSENKFTEWRKEQKRCGNLDWETQSFGERISYNYRAGLKIAKYIQKVSDEHGLAASKGYVDMKIAALEAKVEKLTKSVDDMIELFDPPITDEKREKYGAKAQLHLI